MYDVFVGSTSRVPQYAKGCGDPRADDVNMGVRVLRVAERAGL